MYAKKARWPARPRRQEQTSPLCWKTAAPSRAQCKWPDRKGPAHHSGRIITSRNSASMGGPTCSWKPILPVLSPK